MQSNMDIQYRQQCERRDAYRQECELQVYMPLNVPRVAGAAVTFSTDRQLLRRSQGTDQSSQRESPLQGGRDPGGYKEMSSIFAYLTNSALVM